MNLLEIKIEKLEAEVTNIVGIPVKFEKSIYTRGTGEENLVLTSQDIVNFSGVFNSIMKSVHIETGNSSCYVAGKDDREDLRGDEMVWMTIGFSYKFKTGGSNGNTFLHAWYSVTKDKWFVMHDGSRDLTEL